MAKNRRRPSFGFAAGEILADKYRVIDRLGEGWEGEVYLLEEFRTGVECAAKFFFPRHNPRNVTLRRYARKLHRLRDCPVLIRYRTEEMVETGRGRVHFLVSEYVEGELLTDFLKRQPGRRLDPFQAVHLLHALVLGVQDIHHEGEYHGDIHEENIFVRKRGLGYRVKLIDLHHWDGGRRINMKDDVVDLVKLFGTLVGGKARYAAQPPQVKAICRGLRRDLILARYRNATQLRRALETIDWDAG